MPNAKTHLIVGAVTGAAVNIGLKLKRIEESETGGFDWGELLICSAAAGVAALLPDLLDPATCPNHRKFYHSVTMAAVVAYAITGRHTKQLSAGNLLLLTMLGVGYLSHLAADATTPKCISII